MSKTATLQPVEAVAIDTSIQDGDDSANTTAATMRVGRNSSAEDSKALMEWDLLKGIPESVSAHSIISVTFVLYYVSSWNFPSSATKTLELSVVDGAFGEDATWDDRTSGTAWSSAGGDFVLSLTANTVTYTGDSNLVVTSSSDVSGSILNHVRDAMQTKDKKYRVAVAMASGGPNRYVNFGSSNAADSADRPVLQITYRTARGTGITYSKSFYGRGRGNRTDQAGRNK